MVEHYLMASRGYPLGLVFHPEQGMSKVLKSFQDYQPILPFHGRGQDTIRSGSFHVKLQQSRELWKHLSGLSQASQFIRTDSSFKRPILNIEDTLPNSILFSFGIVEQCTRHEKIFQFLMHGSSEAERDQLDLPTFTDLIGIQSVRIDMNQQPHCPDYRFRFHDDGAQPSLIYPSGDFYSLKSLVGFVGELAGGSEVIVQPDGSVSFMGNGTQMKDILPRIAELYMSKDLTKWRKQSMLVPHFNWLDMNESRANVHASSLNLETVRVTPLKSSGKFKLKPSPKKKANKKAGRERGLYRNNYSLACESLLSIIINQRCHGKAAIISLKNSGPELPQLLTQFAASIAGTGVAVILSVLCKVASGRVPFCASKLLNTGFGFGLVWLSWAVNRLRETVVYISKNSRKMGLKEEEMMWKLNKSVNEILASAATLMAVAVLRLA